MNWGVCGKYCFVWLMVCCLMLIWGVFLGIWYLCLIWRSKFGDLLNLKVCMVCFFVFISMVMSLEWVVLVGSLWFWLVIRFSGGIMRVRKVYGVWRLVWEDVKEVRLGGRLNWLMLCLKLLSLCLVLSFFELLLFDDEYIWLFLGMLCFLLYWIWWIFMFREIFLRFN